MGKVTLFLLCLFIAMMPFEMMIWFEERRPPAHKIVGGLVAVSALVAFVAGQRVRMLSPPMVMRVLISLLCAASFCWSINQRRYAQGHLADGSIARLRVAGLGIRRHFQRPIMCHAHFLFGMAVPMAMALVAYSRGYAGGNRIRRTVHGRGPRSKLPGLHVQRLGNVLRLWHQRAIHSTDSSPGAIGASQFGSLCRPFLQVPAAAFSAW